MVSREELYRLVWSEPINRIAERFDVSGSYLARICTLLNVPRPERVKLGTASRGSSRTAIGSGERMIENGGTQNAPSTCCKHP